MQFRGVKASQFDPAVNRDFEVQLLAGQRHRNWDVVSRFEPAGSERLFEVLLDFALRSVADMPEQVADRLFDLWVPHADNLCLAGSASKGILPKLNWLMVRPGTAFTELTQMLLASGGRRVMIVAGRRSSHPPVSAAGGNVS